MLKFRRETVKSTKVERKKYDNKAFLDGVKRVVKLALVGVMALCLLTSVVLLEVRMRNTLFMNVTWLHHDRNCTNKLPNDVLSVDHSCFDVYHFPEGMLGWQRHLIDFVAATPGLAIFNESIIYKENGEFQKLLKYAKTMQIVIVVIVSIYTVLVIFIIGLVVLRTIKSSKYVEEKHTLFFFVIPIGSIICLNIVIRIVIEALEISMDEYQYRINSIERHILLNDNICFLFPHFPNIFYNISLLCLLASFVIGIYLQDYWILAKRRPEN